MNAAAPPSGEAGQVPPAIVIDAVSKSFPSAGAGTPTLAIEAMSLAVQPEAFVSLLGPSGCGKTTVLRLVDGLIPPDAGSISVFGGRPRPGPDVGFVFQSFRLIPWASVIDNVEFALLSLPLSRAERRERASHHLDLVGLSRVARAYPGELSGGMKQRVALARAFATEPRLLLMDEPFASIDAQTRELMQLELMRLWSRRRSVALFVTHSVDEAIVLSDTIVLMGPRPGRVVEVVEVGLERPRWAYDVRAGKRYAELRSYLSQRLRELVLADPASEFFGRDIIS